MSKWKFYLLLPMFAVLTFGNVSFAQEFDRDALKAELRAELKAELKKELMADLRAETKADVQKATEEATLGLRDVMRSDFADEIRAEIMKEDISSEIDKALEDTAILGGLFKGTTVTGFIDTNYMYNLRNHGEGYGGTRGSGSHTGASAGTAAKNENATAFVNFIGENEDDSFTLENFAMFFDKEATDEHPIGWQAHIYMGEKAKRITFLGERAGTTDSSAGAGGTDDTARNDIFTIATANITWNAPVFGKSVPITMGKMYTWIGYELVENIGNPNYSHGMVYNNAIPFTHMGVSADLSEFLPSDKFGLTLYYVNGWDSFIDNNESKSFGAYLTYEPNDDFFISLAGIIGAEGWNNRSGQSVDADFVTRNNGGNTMMYDIVATYSLPQVEKLSLGFNWDHGYVEDFKTHDGGGMPGLNEAGDGLTDSTSGAHWWAAVGYLMYDFTDAQQGAFRYEYFDDTDGAKAFGGSMYSLTYTQNMTVRENLLIRPEVRYNHYSIPSTPGADDPLTPGGKGNTADDETIIGVGVEYVF